MFHFWQLFKLIDQLTVYMKVLWFQLQLSKWSRRSPWTPFNYKVHRKWMKAQHNLNKFIILKIQMMSILWKKKQKSNLHNYTFSISLSMLEKMYCYSLSPKQTINMIFPTKSITHFLLFFYAWEYSVWKATIKCIKYQLS